MPWSSRGIVDGKQVSQWECKHLTHGGLPEKRSLSLAKLAAFNVKTFPLQDSLPPTTHVNTSLVLRSPLPPGTPYLARTTLDDVVEHIIELARKGHPVLHRSPSIPEDLWFLVKKAVAVRKHLEVNRKDKDSKFRLILIESRIHRLARYYKTKQQIPPHFQV
ncbi:hypothetical protein FIBSPDRAFT_858891 [Athelia psychrophila]|uniref:Ribosomal protein S13/S15 N-terminal domain-containing protein n=1 Tax=Athelia psychrophila TaxID=1759441 RepID=A0A166LQF7_9AGAM|nr:hypothetical protein FIBSPDRAFT_858891 [Fibularhizoctonia sp. CBS 109695]